MIWKKKCSWPTALYWTFQWHLTLEKQPRIWHSKNAIPAPPATRTLEKHTRFSFSFKILISYSVPSFINPQLPWENPHNARNSLYPISVTLCLWRCPGKSGICQKLKTVFNANCVLCKLFCTIQMLYKYNYIAKFAVLLNFESWATRWLFLHVTLPSAKMAFCSPTDRKPLENVSWTDFPMGRWGTSPLQNPSRGWSEETFSPSLLLCLLSQLYSLSDSKWIPWAARLAHGSSDHHVQPGQVTCSC